MKKRLCAAVMFGMATCLFAGCGGNGGGQSGEAVTDTETQAFLDYNVSDYVTLGEYKGLMVQYPVPTVSNEDVEMSIEELLEENTEYKKITIRGVESGDYLTIDFTGTIDGQEFDGGSAEDYEFVIGAEEFPQEFENNLLGKSAGETVTFQMVYPEDYEEEIAGKTAEFTVTVKAVSEMVVPEYNDEFVAKVTDYDTTEAYEEAMREELISDAQEEAAAGAGDEALSLAVGNATVSGYPQALYDACYNSTMEEYQQYADMFGMELDEFIRDFAGEDDLEGITVESVNEILVAQAIAEKEGFSITEKNYAAEAESLAGAYGYESVEDFTADYGKVSVMTMLIREKAVQFLYENAEIEEVSEEEYYGEEELEELTEDTEEQVDEPATE